MKNIILIGLLLVVTFGCTNTKKIATMKVINSFVATYIDTSRYAIFKLEDDSTLFDKTDMPTSLSTEEIYQIENIIDRQIAKINKEYKKSQHTKLNYIENPFKYHKQLIPIINKKGEKEVWVNCFCSLEGISNWRHNIVMVMDGGQCYFSLKINLNKEIAYDLIVNGVA